MGLFSIVLIVASAQGLLLSVALFSKQRNEGQAIKLLAIFIFLISGTLWGRLFFEIPDKSILQWKLLFLGDTIIFLYGPILYLYIRSLFNASVGGLRQVLQHFIPSVIFLVSLIPLFLSEGIQLFQNYARFSLFYSFSEFAAIAQLLVYAILIQKVIQQHSDRKRLSDFAKERVDFFRRFTVAIIGIALIWFFGALLTKFLENGIQYYLIYHLVWLGLAIMIYVIGYISISNSELLDQKEITKKKKGEINFESSRELERIIQTIELSKAYLDSDLTLHKFSSQCNLKPHDLSRILNEHAGLNFSEFVNHYRIKAFLDNLNTKNLESYTILTLAYDAGFNSKTTFNKVFKRVTGLTPSQYIRTELNM